MKLPKVSVIILTKGNLECLFNCINSVKLGTRYDNYEIIIADTGSTTKEIDTLKRYLKDTFHVDKRCKLLQYSRYNFAKINNDIVKNHICDETQLLLFCNDDIELINDPITYMIRFLTLHHHEAGTVGCRLTYETGTIQHAGQTIFTYKQGDGMYLPLSIVHRDYGLQRKECTNVPEQIFSNTGAFSLILRDLFLDIGGFNENYVECFEDVEFNVECLKKGRKNFYLDYAHCVHYEAVTRKKQSDGQHIIRQNYDFNNTLTPFLQENLDHIRPYVTVVSKDHELTEQQV